MGFVDYFLTHADYVVLGILTVVLKREWKFGEEELALMVKTKFYMILFTYLLSLLF